MQPEEHDPINVLLGNVLFGKQDRFNPLTQPLTQIGLDHCATCRLRTSVTDQRDRDTLGLKPAASHLAAELLYDDIRK